MTHTLHRGDCLSVMREMADASVDSIVTDPPYELGFMGKQWDSSGIANNVAMWTEALRVLKPGGHMLAFSGSRTYHRMVCAIEDSGFEVRDQIMWVYSSGFPKSLDVSKAIDKAAGAVREVIGEKKKLQSYGDGINAVFGSGPDKNGVQFITTPATNAAKQWQGWGTALKPAHEPICVARKPLAGTVAANVLGWGVGAINVDGCRVGDEERKTVPTDFGPMSGNRFGDPTRTEHRDRLEEKTYLGRWPANLIHDGSDEVRAAFPDGGNAARFFKEIPGERLIYCAKTSKADRGTGNSHPTVKPTDLMRYLCRLVTPPGGLVLDPFNGSGSTGKAAILEGFHYIGIDLDLDTNSDGTSAGYLDISRSRIEDAERTFQQISHV